MFHFTLCSIPTSFDKGCDYQSLADFRLGIVILFPVLVTFRLKVYCRWMIVGLLDAALDGSFMDISDIDIGRWSQMCGLCNANVSMFGCVSSSVGGYGGYSLELPGNLYTPVLPLPYQACFTVRNWSRDQLRSSP
ncbi:hypothetical protein LOK49_LG09G00736 [Camellia lanceoleosa]|uniref:Uncharacterized protein n=1 Tax=Camellia lanceoleosa TaxID=1840588 RepID=A0ACC0GP52_9ERIC|nr:hypothetical protein LOK49_LG09G00736 [Camellia lanceoleosa]